jgi:hypothetical protein
VAHAIGSFAKLAQKDAALMDISYSPGDIFVTATVLDDSARFPTGHGRIRHYDADWAIKGDYDTGAFGLISSLCIDKTGTLHALDPQARRVDHAGPVKMASLPNKPFGSIIPLDDGTYLMAEHMVGQIPGFEGEGKVWQVNEAGELLKSWNTQTNGGMGGFLGVTHMALSPDKSTLYHVSETGADIYAHDLVNDIRLGAIYTRIDPPPLVFGLACLPDGDLIFATGGGARRIGADGAARFDYELPAGRGWSVIVLREGATSFWALDFFGGQVAEVNVDDGKILQSHDLGLPKALAGIAEVPR